jgi:hypothetical protein
MYIGLIILIVNTKVMVNFSYSPSTQGLPVCLYTGLLVYRVTGILGMDSRPWPHLHLAPGVLGVLLFEHGDEVIIVDLGTHRTLLGDSVVDKQHFNKLREVVKVEMIHLIDLSLMI